MYIFLNQICQSNNHNFLNLLLTEILLTPPYIYQDSSLHKKFYRFYQNLRIFLNGILSLNLTFLTNTPKPCRLEQLY